MRTIAYLFRGMVYHSRPDEPPKDLLVEAGIVEGLMKTIGFTEVTEPLLRQHFGTFREVDVLVARTKEENRTLPTGEALKYMVETGKPLFSKGYRYYFEFGGFYRKVDKAPIQPANSMPVSYFPGVFTTRNDE